MTLLLTVRSVLVDLLPDPVVVDFLPPAADWAVEKLRVRFGDPPCEDWIVFEDAGGLMAMQRSGRQIFRGLELGFGPVLTDLAQEMQRAG